MIGKTLGHYQITNELGKGGMGEVFQAKDQKLGRDVAIKVLPEEFARDIDRVARFQREAKVLASLNHPNIAAIYGLEESSGTNFLVLELVEGQTLADRIKAGPIPVEESLKLALQIAEALEAAHEKGVIHRDLKPANIKITPEGKVKVLDFGLAKAFAGEQKPLNLSNSPTLSDAATQQGIILGTAAYMSPEQAKGKAVDRRADIWAFGVVLFEMLTGRQLFSGETISEILAAVLMREPDFLRLPQNLHSKIIEALERCLEKDARNRYGSISDARVDIQKALADPGDVLMQPKIVAERQSQLRRGLPWIAVIAILCIIIAGLAVWKLRPAEPRQVMHFYYDLPEGQQFSDPHYSILAVSPDGKQFVYSAQKGLYLSSVNDLSPNLIPGTEGDTANPFFSPDGKWVGYFSVVEHKLKKISINGGVPITLCDVVRPAGVSWNEDNTIVYGQFPGDIMRIPAQGGVPDSLVKAKSGFISTPQILPGGKSVLYTSTIGGTDQRIRVQSLKSGETKDLLAGVNACYIPTGHIIYQLQNELLAIPFDIDRLELTGASVPVIQSALMAAHTSQYAVAKSGTLIYLPGSVSIIDQNDQRILVWLDRKGKEEALAAPVRFYKYPNISPDGTKVAVTDYGEKIHDIWIWDLVRKTLTKLTFEGKDNICPVWTLDGKRIAFFTFAHGNGGNANGVYWKAADGTGQDEQLCLTPDRLLFPYCWSSDGKNLIGAELTAAMDATHIGMLSMEGSRARKTLVQQASETSPKISPNGRWLAYTSNESGRDEIYVRPFPDPNKGRWQISTSGGGGPLWSPDGRELFYLTGDAVISVSIKTEPNFDIIGGPQILFRGTFIGPYMGDGTPWAISADGKQFLMLKPQASTGAASKADSLRKISIVTNWFEELKQRVPVK